MQYLAGDRMGKGQRIRVERGTGNQGKVLGAIEPVTCQGSTYGCHVDSQLMGPAGFGQQF